jgi:hypothetical protein
MSIETSPVDSPEAKDQKWKSFVASANLSLTSPEAPRRIQQNVCGLSDAIKVKLSVLDGDEGVDAHSQESDSSLRPSTFDHRLKDDVGSSGTAEMTSASSFSSFVMKSPSRPSKKPERNTSTVVSHGDRKYTVPYDPQDNKAISYPPTDARTILSDALEEAKEDTCDYFFLGINDEEEECIEDLPAKRAGGKIRRIQCPGILSAFSDSELSEASTIDSFPKITNRKKTIKARREARKIEKEIVEVKAEETMLDEDDDVIDTDKDLEGLTGLVTSKIEHNKGEILLVPFDSGLPRQGGNASSRGRARGPSGRPQSLGKINDLDKSSERRRYYSQASRKNKIDRLKEDLQECRLLDNSSTKIRSKHRKKYEEDEESSYEGETCVAKRRLRSNFGSRRHRNGVKVRSSNAGSGKGKARKSSVIQKGCLPSVDDDPDLSLPPSFFVNTDPMDDFVFPRPTVVSMASKRSTRDILQPIPSVISNKASMRMIATLPSFSSSHYSSRSKNTVVSSLSLTTGCSIVSAGTFDDDFSKISETSRKSIISHLTSSSSARRLPKGLLKSLQAPSTTTQKCRTSKKNGSATSQPVAFDLVQENFRLDEFLCQKKK